MENKFEMEVLKRPLLIKYALDEESLHKCKEFGKTVAERI